MQTFLQTLGIANPWKMSIGGRYFRILNATNPVDVILYQAGRVAYEAKDVGGGFWAIPEGGFAEFSIISATIQDVKIAVSQGDGGYDMASLQVSGAVEVSNDTGNPLPVDCKMPTVVTDSAPVTVGTVATLIAAANAARRGVRIYNDGTDKIFLGSASVTVANGAIRIEPGQLYIENEAAAAEWYGISSTAGQSARLQTLS